MASLPEVDPRPISVAEYHRMIDAGILGEDERVELLEGVIATMSPQNDPRGFAIEELNHLLVPQVQGRFRVRVQLPLTLGDRSEPEPDIAIVLPRAARGKGHPTSAVLVIEVSVNLAERRVEVYRNPDAEAGSYRTSLRVEAGHEARAASAAGVVVPVAALFD